MRSKIARYRSVRRRRREILPTFWRRRPWWLVALVVAVAISVLARRAPRPVTSQSDYERYHAKTFRVARVVDGDTVDLAISDGRHAHTRVRLWGVDTPEVADSPAGEMYYGPEASAFTKASLSGRDVEALLVKGKTRGHYGLLLAYLRMPGEEGTFNERLIETGHAYADWRFAHPHKERFLAAERRARRGRMGLWAEVRPEQMPRWRQRSRGSSSVSRMSSAPATSRRPSTRRAGAR